MYICHLGFVFVSPSAGPPPPAPGGTSPPTSWRPAPSLCRSPPFADMYICIHYLSLSLYIYIYIFLHSVVLLLSWARLYSADRSSVPDSEFESATSHVK